MNDIMLEEGVMALVDEFNSTTGDRIVGAVVGAVSPIIVNETITAIYDWVDENTEFFDVGFPGESAYVSVDSLQGYLRSLR